MPFDYTSPLNYPPNSQSSIRRFKYTRVPTVADYKNFQAGDMWLDTSSDDWYICCYKDSTSAIWRRVAGTGAPAEEFLPDAGTSPVVPNATNQITIVGGNGILTTGGLNQWTTDMQSPFEGSFAFENNLTVGSPVTLTVENNDVNVASSAGLVASSEPLAGDAFVLLEIDGTENFSMGIDNSDSDYFKFTNSADPSSGNEIFMVDPSLDTFQYYYSIINQTATVAGGPVIETINNLDNTVGTSNALIDILVGGATAGDPFVHVEVPTGSQYSIGIDNSDTDAFKITDGGSPSAGNTLFQITAAGAPSFPTAPLDVPSGGTGVNSITDHCVIVGSGVNPVTELAAMVDGDLVIGSTGADPVIAQLTGGVGISITSGAGSITIDATGSGLAWVEVTAATQAMAIATSYGCNRGGGVTFTLPATAAAGSVMEIVGMAGIWTLAQNAGQTVHIGNQSSTTGVGGSLTATNAGDCIILRCITANTDFRVQALVGNITVV